MKKPSLQSLAVLFTCFNDRIKASKIAFIALLMLCAGYPGFAQVSVSPASGGTNICSNLAFFGSTPTLTAIGTITVTETVSSDLSIGTDQVVLEAPTGWQFNPTGTPILNFTAGRNITAMSLGAVSASSITVNITVSNTTLLDAFTITGIQVIASNTTSSPGYIYALTSSGILGITTGATGTDFANLSLTSSVAPSVSISPSLSGTICAGLNETFTPTPTNGGVSPTYQWFVNGSSVGTGTPYSSSTLSNGNTVNCIMTPTAGGCYSPATATSNTITMSVNPVPTTVTVTGGGTSCGSTTLTASNGGSGTIYYQGTTSGGTSISTPATSEVISTSGTYYFNAESAAGCWGTQGSAVVVINPLPSAVTVTGGGSFCGGTTTLNASNLGDGTIYYEGTTSNGTSVAAPATSEVIAASGTYYFRAESSLGCWGTQGSQVVTINPIPTTVVASGAGTFCGSTVITAANGGSGTIYFQGTTSGGTSTVLGGSPQTVTTSGTYYFNAESGAGCWGTQGSVAVTINTAATANAGLPQSICAGATVTLAGSIGGSATTSTWSAPSGTFSNVNSLTSSYTPTIATGVVTLTLTTNDPDGAGPCSAATSTVNITVNPLPNTPTVSGGGTSCGSATLTSALVGAGTDYFQGTTSGGTSTTLGLSPQIVTSSGTYYFRAQNGGCWGAQGSAVVTINPLPNPYTVTGGGGYCTGGTGSDVGLSYSDAGVNYQLQRGGVNVGPVMSGTNAPLDFGLQTVAGTYTVVATNPTTGCTLVMGGSAIVSINALPTQFTVTGGGAYCSGGTGVAVGLSGSITGVTYQLKLGGSPVGSPVSGTTGSVITFGPQTAAGTYTVTATTAATGCTNTMLGNAVVTINPSPTTFSVTGGGTYCTGGLGLAVGLAGSTAGISYQLFYGGLPSGPALTGTGSALTFGMETAAGAYTVVATNTVTLCTSNMTGSAVIAISALPSAYAVTGGGSFCSGGTGVDVGLDGSDVGFSYQLYVGGVATGPAIAGTGGAIDFDMQTTGGTYTVVATNIATLCTANMTGSVVVTVDALPTAFTVTGGGPYCTGGFGLAVGLSGSQVGVSYQLYNDFAPVGGTMPGNGSALSWGLEIAAGFYSVVATNTTTLCTNNMTGGVAITVLPLPTAYTVTGGGGYCIGGTGLHVGLSNSDVGVNYQLYLGIVPVSVPVAGTGGSLDFGLQTTGGTYTVVATNISTTCVNNMAGNAVITINPLPAVFNVTGGGAYCSGGTGSDIGLSGSAAGVNYQLFDGATAVGLPMAGIPGALDFGLQMAAGTYTVVATNATTLCTSNMTGSATITINPLPTAYDVTGGGTYCAGGAGFDLGLDGSDVGVTYDLYNGAFIVNTLSGTGGTLDFGVQSAAGTYTVVATNTTTFCQDNMTGSATITVVALPTVYNLSAGGAYCAGGTGVDITLDGSDIGVNYQLYVGGSPIGPSFPGTGSPIDFGSETIGGTYSCVATNAVAGCTNNMNGSAVITVNAAPVAYIVMGGGSYCTGGTGVDVSLSGSDVGINYQLFADGAPVPGGTLAGLPGALDFGLQTTGGNYTIVGTDGGSGCTTNMTGSVTVTVVAYPVVDVIGGPGNVCVGSTITLTDDSTGGIWSSGATTTATIDPSLGVVTGVSPGSATISYAVTNTTGCATTVTANVTVLASPVVSPVIGASSVCLGATTTFTDATGGGVWSSGTATIASVGSTGIVSGVTSGSATISYTVTSSGCSASATAGITVGGPFPASAIIPAAATLCGGMPVGLSDTTAGGGAGLTYQWYLNGVAIPAAVTSVDTATAPGLYTVIISNGLCSETVTGATVVAPPNPVISLDTIPNLLFTGAFVTYQWFLNGVAIPGDTTDNTPQRGPGNVYTVVVSDANGCYDTSAAFIVGDSAITRTPLVATTTDVKIYPNPTSSVLHIDAPVKVFVSILSPDGSVLINHKEAISVNVGELADGLYMIMVYDESDNLLKTEKFVKMQ